MLMTRDGPAAIDAKAKCWSKIKTFAPVKGSSSEYRHNGCMKKLHRVSKKLCIFVSIRTSSNVHEFGR